MMTGQIPAEPGPELELMRALVVADALYLHRPAMAAALPAALYDGADGPAPKGRFDSDNDFRREVAGAVEFAGTTQNTGQFCSILWSWLWSIRTL